MAVPGRRVPDNAPADLAGTELFAVDAYLRDFEARVEEVDADGRRVRLARTAFYPGGGGQPHDLGTLSFASERVPVTKVKREDGRIWHWSRATRVTAVVPSDQPSVPRSCGCPPPPG